MTTRARVAIGVIAVTLLAVALIVALSGGSQSSRPRPGLFLWNFCCRPTARSQKIIGPMIFRTYLQIFTLSRLKERIFPFCVCINIIQIKNLKTRGLIIYIFHIGCDKGPLFLYIGFLSEYIRSAGNYFPWCG